MNNLATVLKGLMKGTKTPNRTLPPRHEFRFTGIGLFSIVLGLMASAPDDCLAGDFANDTAPGKWIHPLVPEDLPPLKFPSYANDLDKAKAEIYGGRYKLGLQSLRTAQGPAPVLADLKFQALSALGRDEQALAVVTDPAIEADPRIELDHIQLLADKGKSGEAIAMAHKHLLAHPDSLRGHYELGKLLESADDFEGAKAAYAWFVAPGQDYLEKWRGQGEKLFTRAEDATTVGLALDRWATLNGEYAKDSGLNDTILDLFVKSYDVIERGYWPARVASAAFYLSRDDAGHAQEELKPALSVNPQALPALELYGRIAVSGYDFAMGDHIVDAIREVNPDSIAAQMLETRNLLQQRQPRQAAQVARRVLARQPLNLEARGLLAATEALQLHDEQTKQLLADVDKVAPNDARAYYEVAEQLSAMRQYPRAAAMFQIAIDRAPWWNDPRNGQGLLFTQSGEEDKALQSLNLAHALDPFNLETTNYLRLLDELSKFGTKESAHFIVRYDSRLDPMIPEYFNDYLESVYKEVTGEYRTEPAVKTVIEVFPTHDAFSVRTTGSPWIGTVGASTGRIIALVTPRRGPNTQNAFNWSQVLRHEFTHTVTLAATDNRIAHWMTEGLAVYEEHSPLQWNWVPMLYRAVTHDELFDMDQLTWMFVRPRKPEDRQMAYAESFWVCTYIEQKYGHEAILKMLAEFKKGGLQEDVFPMILGRKQGEFFDDFKAWTHLQVAGWGYDAESSAKYDKLRDEGETLIKGKNYPAAAKVWEQIVKLRPMDQLPHQRLAGLYLDKSVDQPGKAVGQLKILHQLDIRDDRYAKRISRLYRDIGDLPNAQAFALQAVYIDPYDMDAHVLLREICDKSGDNAGLAREERAIPELQAWKDNQSRQ